MADHDEVPYIVIERRAGGAGAFLWGALLGAGAALLLAPRSGRETRDEIRAGALRIRDRAEDAVRSVTDSVQDAIGDVRGEVEGRLNNARDAFESGRRAARETRDEMEVRVREVRAGIRGGIDAARTGTGTPPPQPATDGAPLARGDEELGV
ncbi:MAG TPA: YtxH domain-containing protein [Longimicrobiales bacterium]|nr:YtxH domain-containing protein [Longimicrobiales bacterium]